MKIWQIVPTVGTAVSNLGLRFSGQGAILNAKDEVDEVAREDAIEVALRRRVPPPRVLQPSAQSVRRTA